jgi:alpha-1,3-glucosyltransferase
LLKLAGGLKLAVTLCCSAVFFPAAYLASVVFSSSCESSSPAAAAASSQQQRQQLFVLAAVLLQPASIIIDHGHFQYNCISLGLAVLAAVAIGKRKDVLGSVLFCLSLNHKQMGLFYAPAFFAHLLGRCLQQPTHTGKVRCMHGSNAV